MKKGMHMKSKTRALTGVLACALAASLLAGCASGRNRLYLRPRRSNVTLGTYTISPGVEPTGDRGPPLAERRSFIFEVQFVTAYPCCFRTLDNQKLHSFLFSIRSNFDSQY